MEPYAKLSLEELMAKTASSAPAPGGGAIAAMTAASAAALIEMVANLTINKKGYEDVEPIMQNIIDETQHLRMRYLNAIDEDASAFEGVIEAIRLPKETPDREKIVQNAFKAAATIPLVLGRDIYILMGLAEQAVHYGNSWVITDGAVAAMNARAAMRSSFYNVRINLKYIKDEDFVERVDTEMHELENKAQLIEEKVEQRYYER